MKLTKFLESNGFKVETFKFAPKGNTNFPSPLLHRKNNGHKSQKDDDSSDNSSDSSDDSSDDSESDDSDSEHEEVVSKKKLKKKKSVRFNTNTNKSQMPSGQGFLPAGRTCCNAGF